MVALRIIRRVAVIRMRALPVQVSETGAIRRL
jgi:hypothetical protein